MTVSISRANRDDAKLIGLKRLLSWKFVKERVIGIWFSLTQFLRSQTSGTDADECDGDNGLG